MTSDLDRVMAAMRSAGWRSTDDRLRRVATKGLATARHHLEQASEKRAAASALGNRYPQESQWYLEEALRHEVRAAERSGEVTRAVRDIAVKLVPSFPGSAEELLRTAEAIALLP